jgi:hypothetical protein
MKRAMNDDLLQALTGWAIIVAVVLGIVAILGSERLRPGTKVRRRFPQFSLATLLYLVTATGVLIGVETATAGTNLNQPAGSLAVWSLFAVGLGLHLWQRTTRRKTRLKSS